MKTCMEQFQLLYSNTTINYMYIPCTYVTGFWKIDHIVTHEINRIFMSILMEFQQAHTSKIFPMLK